MQINPQMRRLIIFIVLIIAALVGLTLANTAFARSHPGGTDFLVQWTGIRTFLTQGESPYSSTAAQNIQTNIYGQATQAGVTVYRFTEPLYSMVLYAPFALIKNYELARGIWMTLLELCLLGIAYLGISLPQRRSKLWLFGVGFAMVALSFTGIQPLVSGNDAIIITLLVMLGIYSIVNENDEVAAIALAFTTIRPLLSALILIFVIIWAIIKHRTTLLYWFFGAIVLLTGFTALLIPDWVVQNIQAFILFLSSAGVGSPGAIMIQAWGDIGLRLAVFWSVVLGGILLVEWIAAFRKDGRHFLWAAFLTLAISQWIGIPTSPDNLILLIPGILFSFAVLLQRWGSKARIGILAVTAVLIGIPWLVNGFGTQPAGQSSGKPVLFFILPLAAIILLYWTKWWAIRPSNNHGQQLLNEI